MPVWMQGLALLALLALRTLVWGVCTCTVLAVAVMGGAVAMMRVAVGVGGVEVLELVAVRCSVRA
jgi:hypothetical protein